jgi:diadenosine tetraphosphate (Ap4A) HIT family hydrolase
MNTFTKIIMSFYALHILSLFATNSDQQNLTHLPTIESTKKENSHMTCFFCDTYHNKQKKINEFEHCFVIADDFPVSLGHTLIVSKTHISDWFSAPSYLISNITYAINETKKLLDKQYKPDGYNIGINCGQAAGQTIMHLHIHLIPRYVNDVANPRGGVRGVIPHKQQY